MCCCSHGRCSDGLAVQVIPAPEPCVLCLLLPLRPVRPEALLLHLLHDVAVTQHFYTP